MESGAVGESRSENRTVPVTVEAAERRVRTGWIAEPGTERAMSARSPTRPPQASRTLSAPGGSGWGSHGSGAGGGEQAHPGDPVDHAVMDLEDQGPLAPGQALDQPGLPQRPVPVEVLGHETPHQSAERGVVTGSRQSRVAHVEAEVEFGIVHPDRSAQLEWHRADALAVAGDHVQFRRDERLQLVDGRRRIGEHARPGDGHVHRTVLQVQELGVECAQFVHVNRSPLSC